MNKRFLRPETIEVFSRLDRFGLKQRDLAQAIGLEENKVSKIKSGERQLKAGEFLRAMEWLNQQDGGPTVSDAEPDENGRPVELYGKPSKLARDLPIYGTALAGEVRIDDCQVEQIELHDADVIGWTSRPAIAAGRADVYGVYVQGSSMSPRHEDGDLLIVETKRPPRISDDVLVFLQNSNGEETRCLIKRLVRRSASYIELEQFNPACVFRIDTSRVTKLHRVIPYRELAG